MTIAISLKNENDILPLLPDVQSLLRDDVQGGRVLLFPSGRHAATDISPSYKSIAGGPAVPDWWAKDQGNVYFSDVYLYRLKDAYYFPEFGVVLSGRGEVMKSTFGEAAYILGDVSNLPRIDGNTPSLDRAIISFPWGANTNYGHFVLDCLPSIALTRQINSLSSFDYAFPNLKRWHREHLGLVSPKAIIELPEKAYHIKDAIFTSCMDHFMHTPNRNMGLLREIEILNARNVQGEMSSRIYLSRKGDQKRAFDDEKYLEYRLRGLSFSIIDPSELTIEEQISVFRKASIVVGFTGAAFTNVLFCSPSTKVIEIMPEHMPGIWVRNVCAVAGAHWNPFFCESSVPDDPQIIGGKEREDVGITIQADVDEIVRYVRSHLPE